jgi:hypothetical protein
MRRVLLLTCAVVATACLNVNRPTVPLGSPFDLKVGNSAVVPGGLAITFDAVTADSRCPIDAMCVTAGEATVAMTLSGSRARVQREWRTNPTNFSVSYDGYEIELRALQPFPSGGKTITQSDYIATIQVLRP